MTKNAPVLAGLLCHFNAPGIFRPSRPCLSEGDEIGVLVLPAFGLMPLPVPGLITALVFFIEVDAFVDFIVVSRES